VLLGIVLSDQLRNYRLLCGIGALAAIGTALLTQSRGGLLGLIVGCAVLGLLWLPSLPRPLVVGSAIATSVVVAIGITGLVLLAPWSVRHEMVTVANWAERERTAHWAAAWEMLVAHPWFGIGAGAFSEQFRTFTTDWRFRISRGHAHNAYLQVAAEAGLLSLMVYLAAIAVLCRRLILVCSARAMAPVAAAMLAALSAVAVHGVFDYLNVLSLGLLFAGTLACAPGLTNKETRHA
ncbi:MAG TPA: O-antigen ligase family protein, partial [Thermomicrobiales bacterium]|nr:O-antigen ligase family protein [Thermomicrobiales bacterium]